MIFKNREHMINFRLQKNREYMDKIYDLLRGIMRNQIEIVNIYREMQDQENDSLQ